MSDFEQEDYQFTADLLRKHMNADRTLFQAVASNNLSIILAALDKAATRVKLEPTDEDRRIDPDVQIIADNLPALIVIREACHSLGWRGEWHLCEALLIELAVLVEGETPPASEAHRVAASIAASPEAGDQAPPDVFTLLARAKAGDLSPNEVGIIIRHTSEAHRFLATLKELNPTKTDEGNSP